MNQHRSQPSFDFARVYGSAPAFSQMYSANSSPFSDEQEPEQFDDWAEEDEDNNGNDDDGGLWQADVEMLAAMAVARSTQTMRRIGPTLASTVERWR